MGYGRRLRLQKSTDARVLTAQLDLIAEATDASRIAAPAWALMLAFLGSDLFGLFGHRSFAVLLIIPVLVGTVNLIAWSLVEKYHRETASKANSSALEAWFPRFIGIDMAISAVWALPAWLLWENGNLVNHLFVAVTFVSVLAKLVINRCTHVDMLVASLIPATSFTALRFFVGGDSLSFEIGILLVLLALQFFRDGHRLTMRLDIDSRLRFEVEDLARELEDARDDALNKRLEAETANASKTSFLANMSHELRTPLNAILGFSEMIEKECFGSLGSPRYKEYAGDIHSSGAHLLSLINDLLDVAKIEAGRMEIEPEELDVRRTFDGALKIMGAKARERRQELVIDIAVDAPPLVADERALKQILVNLVSNAIKFTPEGGRITISGSRARCGSFQILVEDNGPGIPREKLDRIFKPFSQVDNRYDRQGGGTGLGLALVRGLAELHGGRAWLESEAGRGCRAFILLPQDDRSRRAA